MERRQGLVSDWDACVKICSEQVVENPGHCVQRLDPTFKVACLKANTELARVKDNLVNDPVTWACQFVECTDISMVAQFLFSPSPAYHSRMNC